MTHTQKSPNPQVLRIDSSGVVATVGLTTDYDIVTVPSTGGAQTILTAFAGLQQDPSWAAQGVPRLFGADRMDTAIAASKALFPAVGSATVVVLTRSDNFPDALAGTALAFRKNGATLLTPTATLDPRTTAEIIRLLGVSTGKTIFILGGPAAIATTIDPVLTALGYVVNRLAGVDRCDTAVKVAQALGTPSKLFLVTGQSFQAAMAAGVAAAKNDGAVLLTSGSTMCPATAAYLLTRPGVPQVAVGPEAIAAAPLAGTQINGADGAAVSVNVATAFFPSPTVIGLTSSGNFPDGLTGSVDMARRNGPLLETPQDALSPTVKAYLTTNSVAIVTGATYGGPAALSNAVTLAAAKAIVGL